jgi:CHAT domain-containing protein
LGDASALTLVRLPWSRQEASSIAARFPPDRSWMALDFSADRAAVLQARWETYAIAHFATHSLIDARNPELSGIVLSLYDPRGQPIDGFLRVTDVYNLRMPLQLVVLSTCDSANDLAAMGNDVYTLANAFFYAGAPRVVASLWPVNDQAAAVFMSHFYQSLIASRATPAAALRAAKSAMAQDARWHSPAYWSAFVLQGDWQ